TNTPSFYITRQFGLDGPSFATVSACGSSAHAKGVAFNKIQLGYCDLIFDGGAEAPITPNGFNSFSGMGTLAVHEDPMKASRPFDKDRNGFVLGEGAAITVMCSLEFAKKYDIMDKIYCEVLGVGESSDHHHLSQPRADYRGYVQAMQRALKNASLKPEEIDYISAHGTSTQWNDKLESFAIEKVFEEYARKLAVSSQKSMTGHTLGAAGGLEAIACAKTIKEGIITPTINYETPDEDCRLDYVVEGKREQKVRYAMSNSFGFGGHNISIIFSNFDG
ncbi:beta-ketoacyl-[acyl-carrier-protein] synthase family protein, partial [Candidatus Woesearchaeota archaeon]|nr:beta-ketoacyl-[acyl-carrier-protein] synthase family protein [Candidatus Woesearchaeota archaeon]